MTEFDVGARVRVTRAFPPGHIRTPQFVRGHTGTVTRMLGRFPNPERLAYGLSGTPLLRLYQVVFPLSDIWPGGGAFADGDTVTADIYEHWLETV